MELAKELVGVVHVLAGGYVTASIAFMVARLTQRAVRQ